MTNSTTPANEFVVYNSLRFRALIQAGWHIEVMHCTPHPLANVSAQKELQMAEMSPPWWTVKSEEPVS